LTRTNAHADVLSADKDKTIAVLESEVVQHSRHTWQPPMSDSERPIFS
jgi:hypothetical protein